MKLGVEVGLGPGHTVLDGEEPALPRKGHSSPLPSFRPMSIVAAAKRSPVSATAEHLFVLKFLHYMAVRQLLAARK